MTVLPAVRRSRIVRAAPAPRARRGRRAPKSRTGDFIATLKARYPKTADSRFTKALSTRRVRETRRPRNCPRRHFQEEPGLVRAFQSMRPCRSTVRSRPTRSSRRPCWMCDDPAVPRHARQRLPRLFGQAQPRRRMRKPYSEWCYSEWHFGDVERCSRPGHYVIAWDAWSRAPCRTQMS